MSCISTVQIVRAGALCLLAVMGGAAHSQTIGPVNQGAPADPPAGGCMPIGLTASGELVFPFQCKDFIERQKSADKKAAAEDNRKPTAADQKPEAAGEKTAEKKPAAAEVKPAAADAVIAAKQQAKQQESVAPADGQPATETVGAVPLPKRVEREVRERSIGPRRCTHFNSYDPASGTYNTYDGQRRECREAMSTKIGTKAGPPASRVPLPPGSSKAPPQSASGAAAVDSSTTPANTADSGSIVGVKSSSTRAIEAQVAAATTLAEHLTVTTAAPPSDMKENDADKSGRAETTARGGAEKTASAPANYTDLLVAVLMARPDITSVSGLTGKTIAIDDRYSASSGSVRAAIVAAGASEIQLSGGQTKAITRLVNGEVPAAILALVSAEAAGGFPEIAGFKVLRIPLSPRSGMTAGGATEASKN
jgi:hypothetical protein